MDIEMETEETEGQMVVKRQKTEIVTAAEPVTVLTLQVA